MVPRIRTSGASQTPRLRRLASKLCQGEHMGARRFHSLRFYSLKWPLAGTEDRAGGVVWRWKDGDNYYVARANALENNVSLYYTEAGRRRTLKYVDAPVPANKWHTLRVKFSGRRISVALNGKTYIEF